MLHGVEDVHGGIVKQVARWASGGTLCDRHDRLDYVEAIANHRMPIFGIAAQGDPICPPSAAFPAIQALGGGNHHWLELDAGWGHLDPIVGHRAAAELFPQLIQWLQCYREECWTE
jgi:predicted alpha/beta hydrolase